MKSKKTINLYLSIFFVALTVIIIIIMNYFMYKINNERISQKNIIISLNNNINDLNNQNANLKNTIAELKNTENIQNTNIANSLNTSTDNDYEKIVINRNMVVNYNDAISTFLTYIWAWPEAYSECIAEFQDIKNAPKDYLAACATLCAMLEANNNPVKVEFNVFNDMLVKLFGENANGLLNESDIEKAVCINKNSDNTYSFCGFCGSEIETTEYAIKNIQKDNNLFYVELYEYKTKVDKATILLEDNDMTHEYVYDRNNNLILTITIKSESDKHKYYDETGKELIDSDSEGNYIDPVKNLLLQNYKNKLSVRKITLEYLENTNSFIMLNNKLEN